MFELIPWRENRELGRMRDEMDRLFDRFFDDWPFGLSTREGGWMPSVDVSETAKEVVVNAELPGMEPKDIDLSLHDGVLTIRGERKHEHEEKEKAFHRIERRYGSFSRAIRLPSEVELDKVKAAYKDGVLNIRMPKTKQTSVKKIEVKAA
jgi:HSP20 family protein